MKAQAGVAVAFAGLFAVCGAQAQSPMSSRAVAGMYAEAARLGVSAEEAERALQTHASLRAPRDVVAGLEGLVGAWSSTAAGASAVPAKVELSR